MLTVTGIFATGSPEIDRQVIEMPLARFQADFALGSRVNTIAVVGRHLSTINASLPALNAVAQKNHLALRGLDRTRTGAA